MTMSSLQYMIYHYRLPRKLWEGNVFSHVCLSFCLRGGSHVTITHDALDLTVQEPLHSWPHSLLVTSGGQDWRSDEGQRKWAGHILLECFLVIWNICFTAKNSSGSIRPILWRPTQQNKTQNKA